MTDLWVVSRSEYDDILEEVFTLQYNIAHREFARMLVEHPEYGTVQSTGNDAAELTARGDRKYLLTLQRCVLMDE